MTKLLNTTALLLITNAFMLLSLFSPSMILSVPVFILALAGFFAIIVRPFDRKAYTTKIKIMHGGTQLLFAFIVSTTINLVLLLVYFLIRDIADIRTRTLVIHIILGVLGEAVVFWNGIIRVYCTSTQLGIKWRVIGALVGMIPVAHLFALAKIISITENEYLFETEKYEFDNQRVSSQVCRTKYPILLVHGVFFRDIRFFNYWGRIPAALKKNGAEIYYGEQQSAAPVKDCAGEISRRIEAIVKETGCEKINIIAHSKGGLDSRYAVSLLGADKYAASLTTINTPHRGCMFADYLLKKVPEGFKKKVAGAYNSTLKRLGDSNPDFIGAVYDLTAEKCRELNETVKDMPGVYYQSVGSVMKKAKSGKFPLNAAYPLVKHFDGANDGLVSLESAKWGADFTELVPKGKRGISHGDVIDLNRENIRGFDVREFYVKLVSDLKEKGF